MKRTAQIVTALASLLYVSASALAQEDAINAPAQKTIGAQSSKMVPSLAVLNSGRATLSGGKLTMSDVSAELNRVRRPSGKSGRACAHGRFHQAMGRGQ